jgi:hypothetical protein
VDQLEICQRSKSQIVLAGDTRTRTPANINILVSKLGFDDELAVANAAESMQLEIVMVDAP